MAFIPDQPKRIVVDVPYFDDVTSDAGWQGHSTGKTIETLKSEVIAAIGRLGGMVTAFQRGTFVFGEDNREGFQIHYALEGPDGILVAGRLDVAALPVRSDASRRRSLDARRERSLKMALYMLRVALDGTWFLQQLSPGYAPLMPWMIAGAGDKTITQLWSDSAVMQRLLPEPSEDFVEE